MADAPKDELAQLSTFELVRRAVEEARELARAEVELAKQDLRAEVHDAVRGARDIAIAYTCAVLFLASLVTALAVGASHRAGTAIAIIAAALFVVAASILAVIGYGALPKKPLGPTRRRISDDVNQMKEHVA